MAVVERVACPVIRIAAKQSTTAIVALATQIVGRLNRCRMLGVSLRSGKSLHKVTTQERHVNWRVAIFWTVPYRLMIMAKFEAWAALHILVLRAAGG